MALTKTPIELSSTPGIVDNSNATAITIDSSENVGIGTGSPNFTLQIDSNRADATFDANDVSTWADLKIQGDTASGNARGIYFDFDQDTGNDKGAGIVGISGDATGGVGSLAFITTTGNTSAERMRIDSSGDVVVGGISSGANDAVSLSSSGYIQAIVNDDTVGYFNRRTNDGEILRFQKNGTTVGSIGTKSSLMTIGTGTTGLIFDSGQIYPWNTTANAVIDASKDLGASGARFKDLYLSGGVHLGGTSAAHKLDNYEEVAFTATIRGSTAEPATLVTVTGFATKIGRVVQYSIGFENVNTTGYAGTFTITGLPFTNRLSRAMGNLVGYIGLTYTGTECFSVIGVNSTILEGFTISSNSAWGDATHNAGSGRYFWLTGTYMTA